MLKFFLKVLIFLIFLMNSMKFLIFRENLFGLMIKFWICLMIFMKLSLMMMANKKSIKNILLVAL